MFWTFLQLLIIVVEAVSSQPVLRVGTSKQVAVARSEIRVVRRVVKQLPVENLQQCSNAQLYADAHCHGGALRRISEIYWFCSECPYTVYFRVSQHTTAVILVPCCLNSTISILFLPQKTAPTAFCSFLAGNVCLKLSGLFGQCVCIHCFGWSLSSTFTPLQQHGVDGRRQDVADITSGRFLWHGHTKTYSPIWDKYLNSGGDYVEK
jgi:hypothetical protein